MFVDVYTLTMQKGDPNYCSPGSPPIVTLYMIVEDKHRNQQYSEPRQAVAGDGNGTQHTIQLCQQDVQYEWQ